MPLGECCFVGFGVSRPFFQPRTTVYTLHKPYTLVGCRKSKLKLIPVPTPRWPDLLCVYHKTDRLLFSSNMFSAHVAPSVVNTSGESAADVGGWDMYGQDWRHYYDCMLAPVAKQAAGLPLYRYYPSKGGVYFASQHAKPIFRIALVHLMCCPLPTSMYQASWQETYSGGCGQGSMQSTGMTRMHVRTCKCTTSV